MPLTRPNGGLLNLANGVAIGGGATVKKLLTASASLDFPNILVGASATLTIAVAGAAVGDAVLIGLPATGGAPAVEYAAYVSAAGVVTVLARNVGSIAVDPPSATFRVGVVSYT